MSHVGYVACPKCAASHASTHFNDCPHEGMDPRDIRSPLSATFLGFFDEHMFAWFKHMSKTYPIRGTCGFPGKPMNARTFHKTLFDDSTALILNYDA